MARFGIDYWRALVATETRPAIWSGRTKNPVRLDGRLPPDVERLKPDPIERRALNYMRAVDRWWRVCAPGEDFAPFGDPEMNAHNFVSRDFLLRHGACRRPKVRRPK